MIEIQNNPFQILQQHTGSTGHTSTYFQQNFSYALDTAMSTEKGLDDIFAKASSAYQVPEGLIRAIAFHESGYQAQAVSSAGAMGIMQLMPATVQTMGVHDPFDAEQNIMGGTKLLSQLLQKYDGDLKLTLAAYGAGSGNVAKYGGIPPFEETQNFVQDIMSVLQTDFSANRPDPVSFEKLYAQIRDFQNYSAEDYRVFIQAMLSEMQTETEEADTQNKQLFFLGM